MPVILPAIYATPIILLPAINTVSICSSAVRSSRGLSSHDDDVGFLTGLKAAKLVIQLVDLRGNDSGAAQGVIVIILYSKVDHEFQFRYHDIMPNDRAAGVGAKCNGYTRLRRFDEAIVTSAAGHRFLAFGDFPFGDIVLASHVGLRLHQQGREGGGR